MPTRREAYSRHARYYTILAAEAQPHLIGSDMSIWLERVEAAYPNLQAALRWSLENAAETGLDLAERLSSYWELRSHYAEGRQWLTEVIAKSSDSTPLERAKILYRLGRLAAEQDDYTAVRVYIEECLTLYKQSDDSLGIANALDLLGVVKAYDGDQSGAQRLYEEGLRLFQELDDKPGIAKAYAHLGYIYWRLFGPVEAQALFQQSLRLFRQIGDRSGVAKVCADLGNIACSQGCYLQARRYFTESLRIRRELGYRGGVAISLKVLGRLAFHQGQYEEAETYYQESLDIFEMIGNRWEAAWVKILMAEPACGKGDYTAARAHLDEALEWMREWSYRSFAPLATFYLGLVAEGEGDYAQAQACYTHCLAEFKEAPWTTLIHANLGRVACGMRKFEEACAHWKESLPELFKMGDRKSVAECLEGMAQMAVIQSDWERAARLMGIAERLRYVIGAPLPPMFQTAYERNKQAVRMGIGDEAFLEALAAGGRMEWEQVMAYALMLTANHE